MGGLLKSFYAGVPYGSYAAVLGGFVLLQWLLLKVTFLPAERFFEPVLALEIVKALPSLSWRLIPLLIVLGVMAWKWRELGKGWDQWEHGATARVLAILAGIATGWSAATFDHNLYFDQGYVVDRLLVVGCFVGLCWRPVFAWPFVVAVTALVSQKYWPLEEGIHWAAPDMPLRVLILLCAFQLFSLVTRKGNARIFLFLAVCMMVLHYWPSAYAKLRLNWLFHDHIPYFLANTHANGWWAGISGESIGSTINLLGVVNFPMKLFALIAEVGVLFFFWRRKLSLVLLAMLTMLHVGIFLISGICFWQWILVELGLFVLIWKAPVFRSGELYTRGALAASFLIIFTSKWWLSPVGLTWFDSRATYSYRFEATGESGKRYLLPPRFFAPYEEAFTAGRFRFLTEEPGLHVTWGATNRKTANRLKNATTAEEVLKVEAELAVERELWLEKVYSPEHVATMTEFLQRSLSGIEKDRAQRRRLFWIAAPRVIWTLKEEGEYDYEERIVSVRIDQVFTFFDGETIKEVRRRPVLTVEIPKEE